MRRNPGVSRVKRKFSKKRHSLAFPVLAQGYSALVLACESNDDHISTVRLLIETMKHDVQDLGYDGRNLFLLAAEARNNDILIYLGENYPEMCSGKGLSGSSALDLAGWRGLPASQSTIDILVDKFNLDFIETDDDGRNGFLHTET